jgi:hypothetical protein
MRLRYNAKMHCGLSVCFPAPLCSHKYKQNVKTIKFLKYKIYQKARKNRQKNIAEKNLKKTQLEYQKQKSTKTEQM